MLGHVHCARQQPATPHLLSGAVSFSAMGSLQGHYPQGNAGKTKQFSCSVKCSEKHQAGSVNTLAIIVTFDLTTTT